LTLHVFRYYLPINGQASEGVWSGSVRAADEFRARDMVCRRHGFDGLPDGTLIVRVDVSEAAATDGGYGFRLASVEPALEPLKTLVWREEQGVFDTVDGTARKTA
jgi:hypothetical protein